MDMILKAWPMKEKIGKLGFIKTENCFSKDIVKRTKRQAMDQEKIFANDDYL